MTPVERDQEMRRRWAAGYCASREEAIDFLGWCDANGHDAIYGKWAGQARDLLDTYRKLVGP